MSFIGDVKKPRVNYDKGRQVTGLWEQYKRIDGEKTEEVSHLSGKVYTDKEGKEQSFSIKTGDVFKVWPNGFKDQQGDNAPSYILRIYKPDGTVLEVPVEEAVKEESGE
jgi:hypothetical protein